MVTREIVFSGKYSFRNPDSMWVDVFRESGLGTNVPGKWASSKVREFFDGLTTGLHTAVLVEVPYHTPK